jgi:hypothetical protein
LALMLGWLLTTRETVDLDTPARFAISSNVKVDTSTPLLPTQAQTRFERNANRILSKYPHSLFNLWYDGESALIKIIEAFLFCVNSVNN